MGKRLFNKQLLIEYCLSEYFVQQFHQGNRFMKQTLATKQRGILTNGIFDPGDY